MLQVPLKSRFTTLEAGGVTSQVEEEIRAASPSWSAPYDRLTS